MVVKRDTEEIVKDGPTENWTRIPKYRRGRKGIPARFRVTVFGAPRDVEPSVREPQRASGSDSVPAVRPEVESATEAVENPGTAALEQAIPSSEPVSMETEMPTDVPKGLEVGFPPRAIPRHGPGYMSLNTEERRELVRLHNNLGHPEATLFMKFLAERKAEPKFVRAAGDYSCSACLESVPKPKSARPSAIHGDGDFGDVLGLDVAYWKSRQGQTYMFTHAICESTLFHMAVGTGRSPEEQFSALTDRWFSFAGVPQMIYVDPAGEYTSEFWKEQLQRENIKSRVSAAESHWQLGRVEAHGKIIKEILSRMDSEHEIADEQEFRLCLRQAVWAKNSLSRVKGYTPEQAVFGKMSRLPGSIVSDEDASAHSLASSESPEGVSFRRSLQRREQARVALVKADNDNSYRRDLLRRSRPPRQTFEAGDWILYWRAQKGGGSGGKGRWHGPGQVICSEGSKVVWISHCGQLIRASPEQVRSASMREWRTVVLQHGAAPDSSSSGPLRPQSGNMKCLYRILSGFGNRPHWNIPFTIYFVPTWQYQGPLRLDLHQTPTCWNTVLMLLETVVRMAHSLNMKFHRLLLGQVRSGQMQ